MLQEAPSPTVSQRGRRLHLQASKRSLVPSSPHVSRSNLPGRVVAWLFPWTVTEYPGVYRGVLGLLGNRVGWDTVRHWLHDRRPIPPWARAVLADYLEARGRVALDLAAELRALPVRPDKRRSGNREGGNE
jgi:hypothetical protein